MLNITAESFLASATTTFLNPSRSHSRLPQAAKVVSLPYRVERHAAALYSKDLVCRQPCLEMPPFLSTSLDWYFFGASPRKAPASETLPNRAGSSMAVLKLIAVNMPTPGIDVKSFQKTSALVNNTSFLSTIAPQVRGAIVSK